MPMQRSRETTTSVKSVIEREQAVLAKIAPALANLSKMVKSSSFISSSSGTVSMISSASRIASFTSAAVESQESALPLTPASNLPRATPSAKDRRIQAIASTNLWRDIFQHGFVSANSRGIRYSTPHRARANHGDGPHLHSFVFSPAKRAVISAVSCTLLRQNPEPFASRALPPACESDWALWPSAELL